MKEHQEAESSLFYFLRLVISYWKPLLITYFVVGITTVIILLVIPKWYKSEATIVILEENSSPLTNVMSEFASLGFGLGSANNVETYIEYIHTAKMYDRLIEEFDLDEVYETKFKEDTYDAIFSNIGVADNENLTFTISYIFEENPVMAKEIVEYIYKELDQITLEVDKAQASNFKNYIEGYYKATKDQLKADEDSLIRFQKQTGILNLNAQVEATIQGIADLELQKVALEIEKNYIEKSFQNSSRIDETQNKIEAIADKIDELTKNQNIALLAIDNLPQKGADFLRLQRDITVGSEVSEFLRLQYEQALLDEQKINSNLYLVDPPQVPQKRFKPARTRALIIVMFFTFVLSLVLIRIHSFYKMNRDKIIEILS